MCDIYLCRHVLTFFTVSLISIIVMIIFFFFELSYFLKIVSYLLFLNFTLRVS